MALGALLAWPLGAAAQGARKPIVLAANGQRASIAVDDEGTAHVVWNEHVDGGADLLHYCRIPRGSDSCDVSKTLVPPDGEAQYNTDTAGPRVVITGPDQIALLTFRYPNVVTVNSHGSPDPDCYDKYPPPSQECYAGSSKTWIYWSQDDGQTFGAPHVFSHRSPSGDATVLQVPFAEPGSGEPGGTGTGPLIATVTDTESGGTFFESAPPDGYARTSANVGDEGPDRAYGGTVAALDDATPVTAFSDLSGNVYVRQWGGVEPRNDIATWKPAQNIGPGEQPHLAGGPGGVYLMYLDGPGSKSQRPFAVRRWNGTSAGPAVTVSDGGAVLNGDLFEDDEGGLYAAWVRRDGSHDTLRYRFSTDGRSFSDPQTIATGNPSSIWDVGIGAAADGGGWAVYSGDIVGTGPVTLVPFGTSAPRVLVDARPTAIEVTQGIQQTDLPRRSTGSSSQFGLITYQGAPLAENNTTFVRVYADLRRAVPAGLAVPTMTLRAYSNGKPLGGGAILPDALPASLPVGAADAVTDTQRYTPNQAYTFWLPWQWARGDVTLVAEINPKGLAPSLPECGTCRLDDTLRLASIHFQPVTRLTVFPVEVDINGARPTNAANLSSYFKRPGLEVLTPEAIDLVGNTPIIDVGPQLATPNATQSQKEALALQRVRDTASANNQTDKSVYPFGIFPTGKGGGNGLTNGGPLFTSQPASLGDDSRPITSIAHEFGHGLGRVHADLVCGGNTKPQVGEAWPPNNDGALDGVALDTRGSPPYRIFANSDPAKPAGTTYYDLMSYCPAGGVFENLDWMSIRNWTRALQLNQPAASRRRAAGAAVPPARIAAAHPAAAPSLRFFAAIGEDGSAAGAYVTPDAGAPTPVDPGSPYTLVARSAAGADVATAGAIATLVHTHEGNVMLVSGRVAAAGAASVALARDGGAIATRAASKHAPKVRILAPRRGARVGGARSVSVRWRATDADRDALEAVVEYSGDNGKTWRAIYTGANATSARLPSRLLTASRRARLRVRVQDGFHESAATVGPFRSRGAPPQVAIASPPAGSTVVAGSAVALEGSATDDAGTALAGRRLRWLDGRRLLGTGARLITRGLGPGRHRIVLQATDRTGRRARAARVVKVSPAPPRFSVLAAPAALSRRARVVALRVAAIFPARLTIGHQRFALGTRPRRVRVHVRPSRNLLVLRLVLTAGGRRSAATLTIPR